MAGESVDLELAAGYLMRQITLTTLVSTREVYLKSTLDRYRQAENGYNLELDFLSDWGSSGRGVGYSDTRILR